MSLDSITEQIAHFVGTFELTTEQARWRDQYEEFVALRRKAELENLEDPTRIEVKAPLKMNPGDYDPISYKFAPLKSDLPPPAVSPGPVEDAVLMSNPAFGPDVFFPEMLGFGDGVQFNVILKPEFIHQLIGSAVTYTVQKIHLNDNDVVGEGNFRDAEAIMEQGQALKAVAMSLHAVSTPSIHIQDYQSGEAIEQLIEQMQSPVTIDIEGVTVHQFHGEDATGIIVNGEHVDEMPDFLELMPEHHKNDLEEEEDEYGISDDLPAEWDQSEDQEFEDGHSIVAGGNFAVNEVAVTVGWVDAPNIVVGGQAVNLTFVSQVAVVTDVDQGEGAQSKTQVLQASDISTEANEAAWLELNVAEDPEQDPIVSIDWISGDLLVTNFIQQLIDATDIDHIATEITSSSTVYTLGDNILTNVTNILQLGTYYDVIIIGGDMISVDVVTQTIVFTDNDVIHGAHTTDAEDNLVMNQVSLKTEGQDSHTEMSANLASTVDLQEVDTDALEDALLNDPMFAGTELIRVLKIEGDLMQVNVIDQVTMLQDDDDVYVETPGGEEVSALGAGNALLNAASVTKMGVDSVVMAQEGEYSELMLHQASMFDSPEEENPELVNEAIAMLLEEVDAAANEVENAANLTSSEMATIDDGLQTMLA
ncbi:type I secretion protein [Ruegeria profundi]|uniref:Type I secretion protein n=1 Tax=Ruegeria profundi TaxID=1685378 RepID=A0A0X3U2P1_9RHOB|nr:type I secretion protein [Ruegeria profundi]KUJ82298.1 type I secretion protein [Ruegeria profundi]